MKDKENIFFFLIFAAFPLLLFWRGFLPGNIISSGDIVTVDLPFRMFSQQVFLKLHQFPFWMPGILAGIPLLDAPNQAFFYPFDFILMALNIPVYLTYSFDFIFHMMLGAFGSYLFLKGTLKEKAGAIFGALVFMTSGIFASFVAAGHIGNIDASAYIPFVFLFFMKGHDEKKVYWYLAAALCLGLQELANGTQIMVYTFLGASFYMAHLWIRDGMDKKTAVKLLVTLAALPVAAAIFSAPQFIASVKYLSHSWRPGGDYAYLTSYSFDPIRLINFIMPRFFGLLNYDYMERARNTYYIGIIPLLAVPFAFIKSRQRPLAVFFAIAAGIFLTLSFGRHVPFFRVIAMMPVLNSFRVPARYLYLFIFFAAGLAAIGISNIFGSVDSASVKKVLKYSAAAAALFYIIMQVLNLTGVISHFVYELFYINMGKWMPEGWHGIIMGMINTDLAVFAIAAALFYAAVYLKLSGRVGSPWLILTLLCAVHFGDTYLIEKEFVHYVPAPNILQNSFPAAGLLAADKGIYRVMQEGKEGLPNMNMLFGIEALSGYHGMEQKKMKELRDAGGFNNINITRMLNVKYYINSSSENPPAGAKTRRIAAGIYEDDMYMPRFYMASGVVNLDNDAQVLNYLNSPDFKPGQAAVAGHPELKGMGTLQSASIKVIEYQPSEIRLEVDSKNEGLLVISNYYYGSWKALVDNKVSDIYNTNYLVSGIRVHKGKNEIKLYYDGWYVYAGLWLAGAALLAFLMTILYERKKQRATAAA